MPDANFTIGGGGASGENVAYRTVQQVIGIGLMPLVCMVGIVGNSFCVTVFLKPKMRTSTNIYLLVLAFGDLIKLVNDLMYTASVICKYYYAGGENVIYVNYYQFGYFLSQYTSSVAAWMTVAVAFERFLMIVYPTACRGALTVSKAVVACLVISSAVLLVTVPIGLRYRKVPVSSLQNLTNTLTTTVALQPADALEVEFTLAVSDLWTNYFSVGYANFQSSFRCLAPLAVLIVLNACIIVSVRKMRANRRLAARNRITLMLIIVIFLFIAFALPDAAMTLYGLGYHEVTTDTQRIAREITDLLLTLNSAHNIFLYMFFNSIFFEVFLDCYCGCMSGERKSRLIHSHSQRDRQRQDSGIKPENNNDSEAANHEELIELYPKHGTPVISAATDNSAIEKATEALNSATTENSAIEKATEALNSATEDIVAVNSGAI